MKYQILFYEKNISICRLLKILLRVHAKRYKYGIRWLGVFDGIVFTDCLLLIIA